MVNPARLFCLCALLLSSLPCLSQDQSHPEPVTLQPNLPDANATQDQEQDAGPSAVSGVVLLGKAPSPQQLAAAKLALTGGSIVEMTNESSVDFDAWLDVSIPPEGEIRSIISAAPTGSSGGGLSYSFNVNPTPAIIAADIDANGALHGYECEVVPRIFPAQGQGEKDCASAFSAWAVQEQSANATAAFPLPDFTDWTTEAILAEDSFDSSGDYFSNRIRLYRLNDISPQSDWYLIVRDPTSTPNLTHCQAGLHCGWYTTRRDFQTSLDRALAGTAGFSLYDWTPKNDIGSSTGQFTIGLSLVGVVPSPNVGYTFFWQQPDVKTTVYSAVPQKEVSWVEGFAGGGPFSKPPITSTNSFMSHNGVIFQVPQGTSAFNALLFSRLDFIDVGSFLTYKDNIEQRPVIKVVAPEFSVNTSYARVLPKGKALVYLTSRFPGYSQRLKWKVIASPAWLQVSPGSGADPTYLTLQENGGATPGSVGYVELTTDPPYAAPSVEAGPLRIEVQVVSTLPTSGVLLAGGAAWGSSRPLSTAEIWDPETQKTRGTFNDMTIGRELHTATLLPSGKILIAGGLGPRYTRTENSDLFDPTTQMFSATGYLITGRYSHTATLLPNGMVLIAGGCCDPYGNSFKSAELYNPATGAFSATGTMVAARQRHTATLLDNGLVLLTGGGKTESDQIGLNSAELYNPATGAFTSTGNMSVPRVEQTANLLQNGAVIVAGGTSTTEPATIAELYSPFNGVFTRTGLTGTMAARRIGHAAVRLVDGRLVLAGGTNGLKTAEFYDPPPSYFYFTRGSMTEQRDHPAGTLLLNTETALDGRVLFAGGVVQNTGSSNGTLLELFNPATEVFSPAGNMSSSRTGLTTTLLGPPPQ